MPNVTATEVLLKLEEYMKNDARLSDLFNTRFNDMLLGQLYRTTILNALVVNIPVTVTRQNMIIYNASDKFITLHERRIRSTLRSGGGSPKKIGIVLLEVLHLPIKLQAGEQEVKYVVNLELITNNDPQTGDIVLTPLNEIDLETIEKWETRNEKFNLNDF